MTLEPTPTTGPSLSRIAVVMTDDRALGVQRALAMLGLGGFQAKRLLIKPNFNSAHPAPGSTANEVLIPVIEWLQEQGADRLTVGDRSGMGDTRAVMDQKGIPGLAHDYGFDLLVFDDLGAEDWVRVDFAGIQWPGGVPVARPVLEADGVISLCCLKTHRFGGQFTLSLKNSVGTVAKSIPGEGYNYMNFLHGSEKQRELIAEINRAFSPDLIVMDGVDAFVNGGPEAGKGEHPGVILAGTDRVAMDAVGVAILRSFGTTREVRNGPIFGQAQIRRAVELGLGADGPAKIELLAEDAESRAFAGQIRQILDLG
jgi:uncharacterized protein (DUF362 family)